MAILVSIPRGVTPVLCKVPECRRPLWWVTTGTGRKVPLDMEAAGCKPPSKVLPGQGAPHWDSCVAAKKGKK